VAAVVLSLMLAVIAGGTVWLVLGTRLHLDDEPAANELLNVAAYTAIAFPLLLIGTYLWAP